MLDQYVPRPRSAPDVSALLPHADKEFRDFGAMSGMNASGMQQTEMASAFKNRRRGNATGTNTVFCRLSPACF